MKYEIGQVIRFNAKNSKKYGYGLIVHTKEKSDGFYYIKCSKFGAIEFYLGNEAISAANYINHSNMLVGEVIKVIKGIDLTIVDGIASTGITRIDNYMMQLNGVYNLFIDNATPELVSRFYFNEDRNYHEDNGVLLANWYKDFKKKAA